MYQTPTDPPPGELVQIVQIVVDELGVVGALLILAIVLWLLSRNPVIARLIGKGNGKAKTDTDEYVVAGVNGQRKTLIETQAALVAAQKSCTDALTAAQAELTIAFKTIEYLTASNEGLRERNERLEK